MLIKSLLLGAALASTPICLLSSQDPERPDTPSAPRAAAAKDPLPATAARVQQQLDRAERELQRAQRQLEQAERQMQRMRQQLDGALDRLDEAFVPERDRDCSPSRSRALMSHYQWLRDEGHGDRAQGALGRIVDQVGDNVQRLNSVAWDLMTEKATAGRFDELALALAERMERQQGRLHHRYLDTIALARFLNGQVERAVALQQQAIARGGDSDDYRRRLRTYQAAQTAIARAAAEPSSRTAPLAAAAAGQNDEDDE